MFKRENIKGFILGSIVTVAVATTISVFAEPLYKQISVNMGGVYKWRIVF